MMDEWIRIVLAIIHRSGLLLLQLIPFVLAGSLFGAILQRWKCSGLLGRIKGIPTVSLIVLSALLGVVSPFCTMGTVPVVAGLLANGFPLGAGIAFLAASSIVNPQMLLIQYATLGPVLTALQGLSGLGIGVLAGIGIQVAQKKGIPALNPGVSTSDSMAKAGNKGQRSYWALFWGQLEFMISYMILGVLIASAVAELLPTGYLEKIAKLPFLPAAVLGALASVPMYVCGGSSMPVLGALMEKGMPSGTALAFIIAGPATRIQALTTLKILVNKKVLLAYVILVLGWAIAMGMILDIAFAGGPVYLGLQ